MTLAFSLCAIVLYVAFGLRLLRNQGHWTLLLAAVAVHFAALSGAINYNFTASLSWVSATMALLATGMMWKSTERFLPMLASAAAILSITIHLLFPGRNSGQEDWQIQSHAALAITAYATLSLAALLAILLLRADDMLKDRKPLPAWMPALSRLERQLFELTGLGFALLTLTLVSGTLFIENWFAQHIVHKTVLTIAAWLVFGVLLLGHWRFGWRGRKAANLTLAGMGLLLLAFFGAKFVLELILQRAP